MIISIRSLFIGTFLIGIATSAMCQIKQPRIIAGMAFASAKPSGKFASTNILDEKSGFAKNGFTIGVDGTIFLERNFGLCGSIRIGSNATDVQQIANGFASVFGGTFTVNASRWYHMNVYGGAHVTVPIGKFNMDLKIMPGFSDNIYPEITAQSDQYVYYQYSEPTRSIAFCASTAVRYKIKESWTISLFTEMNRTKTEFNVRSENNGTETYQLLNQPIFSNNLGFMVFYNIY